jgi:tellurite resistance protein
MEEGGHAAGLIRIYMAVANASKDIKRLHFEIADKIAKTHKVLSKIRPSKFKKIMHEQTALLQANEDKAIETLSVLIKDKHDRLEALSIARRLCQVDGACDDTEKNMLDKIKKGLKL